MPVPVKARTPAAAAPTTLSPEADVARPSVPSGGTAMAPTTADVVRARLQVGNAAVTTALGDLPAGTARKPAEWAGRMLLAGQDLVGNQAVAKQAAAAPAVPGQQATKKPKPAAPAPPKTKAPPAPKPELPEKAAAERAEKGAQKDDATGPRSPGADPKFQALKKDVGAKKRRIGSSHPPATTEAGAAQSASVPPADDQEARGKAAHAEDMDAAQPKEFDKAAFVKAVEDAIAKRAPKNLDEADKFGDSGKADEVKAEVQGEVDAGKEDSARDIADTTAAVPEPAPDRKEVVPLAADKVPGRPGAPDPAQAAPDPLPASATDMSAGPAQVRGQMAAADVTEQQLSFKNSREPGFDKAVADKKAMDEHSATAPGELRAGEKKEIKQVKATAATKGAAAMTAIHATRVATGRQVGTGKQGTKGRDEDKRATVTKLLQDVFDKTKCDVEKILSDLDKTVDEQFTSEEKKARNKFTEEHTEGMREYKRKRYKGLTGKARWVKDLFADLPDEANQIYVRAKDHYLTAMRGVIGNIANTVERELRKAKDRIASGRKELKTAVDNLPKDLKAIGREAAAEFDGKFDELTDSVNDKGTALVDTLATKYTDAVKAVDAEIAAEKEKNKGLVSKAADAIGGVINTIRELGRMLMGVLRKAASAVGLILRDPIGFLGNLITGVGGGLKLFMRNAGRHLQQGVLAWLLGTGIGAGFQLPATFDVLGILVMIAGLLGLSWPNIRARLARKVDPRAMAAAEKGADAIPIVLAAKKRGVAGLWSDLKTRVGDLKKDLIGKLVSYLLPTIIIAGVTWIVSLFNPASAFIRACKMIIDIIRFIVTQGRQIIEFVNTVLDAVIAIARGGTGGVPALVERALARSIPVLIGALAAILGIGGIAGKVKQIFQALARPVNRAIDWVIDKITGLLKKLWAKLKAKLDARKKRKKKDPKKDDPKDKQSRLDKGVAAAVAVVNRFSGRTVGKRLITPLLVVVRVKNRMTSLKVAEENGHWVVIGVVNPSKKKASGAKAASDAGLAGLRKIHQVAVNTIKNKLKRAWNNNTVKKKLAADQALRSGLQKEHDRLNRAMTGKTEDAYQALISGNETTADVSKLFRVYRAHVDAADHLISRLEDLTKSPEELSADEERTRATIRRNRDEAKRIIADPDVVGVLGLSSFADLQNRLSSRGRVLDDVVSRMATMKLSELREHALTAVKFLHDAKDAKNLANVSDAIEPYLKKIEDICLNTTREGKEDANVGDGSSEDAARKEAETGKPIKGRAHGPKCRTEARGLRSAVTVLRQLRGRTSDGGVHRRIDDAVTKAQDRATKLESGAKAWEDRVRNFPAVWTADGVSKVEPPFGRGI